MKKFIAFLLGLGVVFLLRYFVLGETINGILQERQMQAEAAFMRAQQNNF